MATNAIPDSKCTETTDKTLSNENQPTVKTLSVKLVKNSKKKMHVMQFNAEVKFADWKQARLRRENNYSLHSHPVNYEPKFGGGSTYVRATREEMRNRRFARKYKPENQPWILRTNSSIDKKKREKDKSFKGAREGGVGEHSSYYIFVQNADGKSLSAYPLQDWYKFLPINRYKTLSADEAEKEFMRRYQRLNYFSLMTQKRLRGEEENQDAKLQENTSINDLTISEMDGWISSDEDDDDSDEENRSDNDMNKKKKKKAKLKKKNEPVTEAFEESDDGDEEGRECEYITDSSASESELEKQNEEGAKSVAEETGLKNLLSSDAESEVDENENEFNDERKDKEKPACGADKSVNLQGAEKENKSAGFNLLSATKDKIARKDEAKFQKRTMSESSDKTQTKRFKSVSTFSESSYISGASESGITIEAVSRYLKRKPMTTVDLLKKFKMKKKDLDTQEVGRILMLTLEKIKLKKKQIKGATHYYL